MTQSNDQPKVGLDVLGELQAWYLSQCNEEWEHSWGIRISTLDNPGWYFKVDLNETSLANKSFEKLTDDYDSERHWLICSVKDQKFEAFCGPERLSDVISVFLKWAKQQ